jgi:hypothetical protein
MLVPDAIVEVEGGGTIMIELDGPQHFALHAHFHDDEEEFHDQIRRDCAKNLYAREHGWGLLRIAHTQYRALERIVDEYISEFIVTGSYIGTSDAKKYAEIPRIH